MKTIRMDNRSLLPPEPLVRILAACDTLESGDRIEAQMDRRPIFLFPELEERGLRYDCVERDDWFLVTVERPGTND
jgi:uncharacterized protein (DUF2249 family)